MLHIIHQSNSLKNCLAALSLEDTLLFIENGVFCLLQNTEFEEPLKILAQEGKIYVLNEHAQERAVSSRLLDSIHRINYDEFVELTIENASILNW